MIKQQQLQILKMNWQDLSKRDWEKYHTSRNLATSIAIETAELLEYFQWKNPTKKNRDEIQNELADILIYCIEFAIVNKIDIATAIEKKIEHNAKKYPLTLFNKKRKGLKDYERIKKEYRAKK